MSTTPAAYKLTQITVFGTVLIALFAGTACSRDLALLSDNIQPPSSNPTPADPESLDLEETIPVQSATILHQNRDQPPAEVSKTQDLKTPNNDAKVDEENINQAKVLADLQLSEIRTLYRRLHIELDSLGRSKLIVELFNDPRHEIRMLGFDLADRDLSSSTALDAQVSESAKSQLQDPNPVIRSKAARLISRLVPPDAMLVLTSALNIEDSPVAAEPMLLGVARWPNPEAVSSVMRWFVADNAPFNAACQAVWSLEQANLLDAESYHPVLITELRENAPEQLGAEGMKLIAKIGDASDLSSMVQLLLHDNTSLQQWAANALVETPRAVEVLAQAAEGNQAIFHAAADSLIAHRATPEGLRRLASLPYPDEESRTDALIQMGQSIKIDRLAEAVRLADLDPASSVLLLQRLLNGNIEISSRTAKGIILLAQIELNQSRPNRAYEAAIALDTFTLEPNDRIRIDKIKVGSMILLGRMTEAYEINSEVQVWLNAITLAFDQELKRRVALFILNTFPESLSEDQTKLVEEYAKHEVPVSDTEQGSQKSQTESPNEDPS